MKDHTLELRPIGFIHSPFKEKFGIPRQSNLVDAVCYITFEGEAGNPDCFRGIEEYSHLWLVWGFSENKREAWSPTVRPPRLGGNTRKGVFATRSPFRPNPLGLSCVMFERVENDRADGLRLYVRGADLMDGTPIYDIKPYIPYADAYPDAAYEFARKGLEHRLCVHDSNQVLRSLSEEERAHLMEVLALDPRPSYQDNPDRVYGMRYGEYNVKFQVKEQDLFVLALESC